MVQTYNEKERRQSFRLNMEEEIVDIFWRDSQGVEQTKKIACLDFSRGGLRACCEQPIELQSTATVIFKAANPNSQKLYGRVIRCIQTKKNHYEVALRLDEDKSEYIQ